MKIQRLFISFFYKTCHCGVSIAVSSICPFIHKQQDKQATSDNHVKQASRVCFVHITTTVQMGQQVSFRVKLHLSTLNFQEKIQT